MILRAALVSLFAACLFCLPATASRPEGLAANLITDLGDPSWLTLPPSGGQCDYGPLLWYEFFGLHDVGAADVLTLEMAIVPFRSGTTGVSLDMIDGPTFFGIEFSNGLVDGLPYDRSGWNDVVVVLRPATQDYVLTVNGVQGGPFPFADFCADQGGCFSVQALRISGYANEVGSAAWVDTIAVSRDSAAGRERLHDVMFDTCFRQRPYVIGGAIMILEPPRRIFPRGHCDGR